MIIEKPTDCSGTMWGARPRLCSTELHHSPERSPRSESAGIHAPLEEAVIYSTGQSGVENGFGARAWAYCRRW